MPAGATDVLIRGAGPVGCALALALRGSRLRVALLRGAHAGAGFRPIALSHASRLILERLGTWAAIPAAPIDTIHVSQQHGFGRMVMDAADAGVPALGYVAEYSTLLAVLQERCRDLFVEEGAAARCVVHAEGASSDAREKRYAQDALVARVRMQPPAGGVAHERFTAEGPLALLPLAGDYAVIWSCRPERAAWLAQAGESAFLEALAGAAGSRPGRAQAVEARAVQPLALRVRALRVGAREVYIGNAAQSLHPVAGQGLNLGLRDAWELARFLRQADDPGAPGVLAAFASARRFDAAATVRLTDALAGAFIGSSRLARAARGAALTALDVLPAPRRFFARRMIFGPSALP